MYKFNLTDDKCTRQQIPVMVTGYWNECYIDENPEVCRDTGKREPNSQGITQLQHQPESSQAPSNHVYHIYDASVEKIDNNLSGKENRDGKLQKQRRDVQIDVMANARGAASERCTQTNTLESDKCKKTGDDEGDVPDGGWGYMVLLGCCLIMNFTAVIGPCFGILFSKFLLDLGTSSATSAWIYNAGNFMWSLSVLLVNPLLKSLGCRMVAVIGGLLSSIGLGISAFAPSAQFLLFSYSGLVGFGHGMSSLVVNVIIPQYFKRRRGRAFAVVNAGVCTGQTVWPLLVTYLQQESGFTIATLIVAVLLLNICVAASVFHPVEWHTSKTSHKGEKNSDPSSHHTESGCGVTLLRTLTTLLASFTLFRSLRVLIIIVGNSFNLAGYLTFFTMFPFIMADAGYTQEEVSWCMSVSGVSNLVTRMVVASMTDWPWFSKRGCYMVGAATVAIMVGVSSVVKELWVMAVVAGVWGCGVGACLVLGNLVILDYVGVENFASAFGISSFTNGIWLLAFGSIFGVIRDVSGSYQISLWVLAFTVFLTVILWLMMPAAVAYDQRKKAQQQQQEAQQQQQQEAQQQQQQEAQQQQQQEEA